MSVGHSLSQVSLSGQFSQSLSQSLHGHESQSLSHLSHEHLPSLQQSVHSAIWQDLQKDFVTSAIDGHPPQHEDSVEQDIDCD